MNHYEPKQEETIWFPGIYGGRTDDEFTQLALDIPETQLIELVQKRAQEDGEWAIDNGFVGDNEDKMRSMMAFVSDEKNIKQAITWVRENESTQGRTVDYICRDLANASKWAASRG